MGRNDHFFEMGGHSLLATRVCSLIQEKLGIRPPLSTLFERPVVRDFASVIHADASPDRLFSKPIVHETGNQKNNPLSFPQQAIWLLNRMDEKHTVFNIPLVVKIKGALRIRCFQDALNAVIHRHSILRTTFHMTDQTLFQARLPELVLTVPVKDLSHLKEPAKSIEFRRAADDLGNHVFDLTTGPLLKAVLIKDSADEYRMLLTIHHIIMDGWSAGIFFAELGNCYDAKVNGRKLPALTKGIDYADFAIWQREQIKKNAFNRHLKYWKKKLKETLLNPPTDWNSLASDFEEAIRPGGRQERLPRGDDPDRRARSSGICGDDARLQRIYEKIRDREGRFPYA